MKDEEMAEEYICNGKCQDDITRNYVHCKTCTRLNDFLAGLRAGRPQWHKVSDGDLPKEQKEYWCKVFLYESEETFNAFLWFDINTKDFKLLEEIENGVESTFNIKEWCEIPTFDKE